jgi:hypothetical protein
VLLSSKDITKSLVCFVLGEAEDVDAYLRLDFVSMSQHHIPRPICNQ